MEYFTIVWLDRSFCFLACVIYNSRRRKQCLAFFEIVHFWSTIWVFKKPFYLLDIIECTPKSCPILTCTNMKLDALPKNEWNEIFKITDTMRLIKHLIKFLQKLSKIETDKNFLKRGKVDVIIFTQSINILLIYNGFSKLWLRFP